MKRTLDLDTLTLESGAHDEDGAYCVMGIQVKPADLERFRSKLRPLDNGCIEWTGSTMWKGYGRFWVGGQCVRAHRFSYALSSDLPLGMHLDHLCRNRLCVNPLHLEPVTPRENVLRSPIAPARLNSEKTHCPKGHPYSGDNLLVRASGIRECRACGRVESASYMSRHRDAVNARAREKRAARRSA